MISRIIIRENKKLFSIKRRGVITYADTTRFYIWQKPEKMERRHSRERLKYP